MQKENTLPCRHRFDKEMAVRLREMLLNLDSLHPDILSMNEIEVDDYPLLLNSAIQSIRGTIAAKYSDKANFVKAILDYMVENEKIRYWEFQGSAGRNDYRVEMIDDRLIAIEMKGCPDGNNMTIWERPSWADEFIIWSQCPESLSKDPGLGVWSGISIRLFPKIIVDQVLVDALIFYDGRCGSKIRRCPKNFGIHGNLRNIATDIAGQDKKDYMPPPCIYLFPRTTPHIRTNQSPPLNNLKTCKFARALLRTFNVPDEHLRDEAHWAKLELKSDERGDFRKVSVGMGLDNKIPNVQSRWIQLKRE